MAPYHIDFSNEIQLEKFKKEFNNFVYIVSHDLKGNMRSIRNLSDWIVEDMGDTASVDVIKHLKLMRQRIEKMERMMSGLAELSKITHQSHQPQHYEFKPSINKLIETLNFPRKVSFEIQGDIPELSTDPGLIEQVWTQLIDNAVKFNTNPNPRILINAREHENSIEFSVTDNGPGIDKKHHERIFNVFSVLAPGDQTQDIGMGLTLAKKIVEDLMGGSIRIESALNEGTTIRFFWPKYANSLLSTQER